MRPSINPGARQLAEIQLITGPADDEVPALRDLGYRPETTEESTRSRLAFEEFLADHLLEEQVSRQELRVWVMARELIHEYLDLFNELVAEYRVRPFRTAAADSVQPGSQRAEAMQLADRVPTMRVAADMKLEVFRNPQHRWTANMLHDIDAISAAVPYCHIVMPDRDAADLLMRSKAHTRSGTLVITKFAELPNALAELTVPPDLTDISGWDTVGPPAPFCSSPDDLPWTVPDIPH